MINLTQLIEKVLGILALFIGAFLSLKKAEATGANEARAEVEVESNRQAVEEMKVENEISNDVNNASDDELIERMRKRARENK